MTIIGQYILILITSVIIGMTPRVSNAEDPTDAIARIRSGPHAPMPPPETSHASGGPGKGMTIENGTGYLLRIHFSGPVTRTADVPDGQSVDVELVVGGYEVAAEVPGALVTPFYGKQKYEPNFHYWLKFFVERQYR